MVIFVDLEHERLRQNPSLWRFFASKTLETKYRLESITGDDCLIVHHKRFTPSHVERLNPCAVIVGGNYTGFQHFKEADLSGVKRFMLEPSRPTLAICGGFQLLIQVHGGELGPMRPDAAEKNGHSLDTDTPLPEELLSSEVLPPETDASFERGFVPVFISVPAPLFNGLPERALFYELHGGEVKTLPEAFYVTASSNRCEIQAVGHRFYPLFGVQFHPEAFDDDHPDGRRVFENFLRFAES